MKWNELKKLAEASGWYLLKHGKKHDIYVHPTNRNRLVIGIHGSEEVPVGTCMKLIKQMGI
ncbi:MAG: type II toxin-antitoxin system HicA family toxin [Bacteroidales bacterium]|nr:type II toxin-antitoxin system HicA family toxin [Bacteroidales bacterium]